MGKAPVRATHNITFLVVDTPFDYNILFGRPGIRQFRAIPSTFHNRINFPTIHGVGQEVGNIVEAWKCYTMSTRRMSAPGLPLETTRGGPPVLPHGGIFMIRNSVQKPPPSGAPKSLGPSRIMELEDFKVIPPITTAPSQKKKFGLESKLEPKEAIKEISIDPTDLEKKVRIGTEMKSEVEINLIASLEANADVFAWKTDDLTGIDPRVAVHRLNMDPKITHIHQKKKDFRAVEDAIIKAEVDRLLKAGHIREVRYSNWICNVVLVQKPGGKWRMCNDFTRLNKYCPKDPYPLPRIDQLVDSTAGCALLSFMDAYQGFYQIRMAKEDIERTSFFTAGAVYCFVVMPFGLKNAGATYQRLVNKMFAEEIGKTMEVYVDDMLVKSKTEEEHIAHLNILAPSVGRELILSLVILFCIPDTYLSDCPPTVGHFR